MRNPEQMEIPRVELTPWAREELKVGPETGAEQFRQTLFERLEKESWLPATETQYALETLALRSAEDRKATVGVGGAITALSVPSEELFEIKLPARAPLAALGSQ